MKNLGEMWKQAQQMQERLGEMQRNLEEMRLSGTAGGGMVTIELDGKGRVVSVQIEPELCKPEDVGILCDLIVAASRDARVHLDEEISRRFGELTGGQPLPAGLKGLF